ncbi:putative mitochondrial carrier protein [Aspergillus clavatus NRRL 1]|uniref:Mitochondrial carrier protein, putative n=1 Tax=Aspergillus clavatus (strain ATCC 1007 / CBS 513.65 / DSM 816 / NCTC 3887 / NRRL 1 / QM 1276 / 107) TaxID=344612 RepID=A1CDM2_ASPCL|nr:mitochondrial carrier protein, putative [Aspergillus clavatus NRRL 1]EAW11949.1 mitochondrial carrier protein, putative [Aspergillus clavatus NRRL 1]
MSLTSRVFSLFSTTETPTSDPSPASATSYLQTAPSGDHTRRDAGASMRRDNNAHAQYDDLMEEEEEPRPPYLHAMLAGGTGGTCGDMLMHSLDTVKTRQQGDPHFPPKYTSMTSSYATIYRQEGLLRGLYGGVTPALLGSFPGTVTFFGTYEFTKRWMLDVGINANVAYLSGGFFADLAASIVYVPSEVLKTRLQLQGRYNNPYSNSGYNYRSTSDALRTIIRKEGFSALFHGYRATIYRDLPFSALQFAFYEQERRLAKQWVGSKDIGLGLEVLTAATAGGMAGVLTCPMDVVKTRIQTQQNPDIVKTGSSSSKPPAEHPSAKENPRQHSLNQSTSNLRTHSRPISTGGASTSVRPPGTPRLDTSSFFTGLKMIYQTEGLAGWFRGVGPRGVWTSIQSGTMLVMYQYLLKQLENWQNRGETGPI